MSTLSIDFFLLYIMNAILKTTMMVIENEKEAYKAVDSSGLLSKSQKNIIKYIISFDLDRGVTSLSLMEFMKVSKQAVNFSLQQLIKRDFVTRYKDKVFIYRIKPSKFNELLHDYRKKQTLSFN